VRSMLGPRSQSFQIGDTRGRVEARRVHSNNPPRHLRARHLRRAEPRIIQEMFTPRIARLPRRPRTMDPTSGAAVCAPQIKRGHPC
jgi:hypothetical protein